MSDLAEITGQYPGSCLSKKLYFLSVGFSSGGGAPLPAMILAGRSQRRNPCEVRSSLSQFPLRRTSLPPTGRKTATRSSYADVRFVNGIRSLVTDVAASRRTTSITTGFGSIAAAAPIAGRPSLSFRCSLFLTRISVCWRAVRHCCGALWSTVRGRRHCPSSRTLIGCPILPQSAAGRVVWTFLNRRFPFSARPSTRVAHWLARGHQALDETGPLSWITPALEVLWPLRL